MDLEVQVRKSMPEVAAERRGRDFKYIKGSVIDIGCGNFPISELYDGITEFKGWDAYDGDANTMQGCRNYDCVHSSHSLEHMHDPYVTLQRWIDLANKYIVLILPDEEMYERNTWPSEHNMDHKVSFRFGGTSKLPKSIDVKHLVAQMKNVKVISMKRITEGFDPKDLEDQTSKGIECAIEVILEKV